MPALLGANPVWSYAAVRHEYIQTRGRQSAEALDGILDSLRRDGDYMRRRAERQAEARQACKTMTDTNQTRSTVQLIALIGQEAVKCLLIPEFDLKCYESRVPCLGNCRFWQGWVEGLSFQPASIRQADRPPPSLGERVKESIDKACSHACIFACRDCNSHVPLCCHALNGAPGFSVYRRGDFAHCRVMYFASNAEAGMLLMQALIADFFFILVALAWFAAGLGVKAATASSVRRCRALFFLM